MNVTLKKCLILLPLSLMACATPRSKFAPLPQHPTLRVFSDFTLTNESKPADLLDVYHNQEIAGTVFKRLNPLLSKKGFDLVGTELSCMGCAFTGKPYQLQVRVTADITRWNTSTISVQKAPFYFADVYKNSPEKSEALRIAFVTLRSKIAAGDPHGVVVPDIAHLRSASNEDFGLFIVADWRDVSFLKGLVVTAPMAVLETYFTRIPIMNNVYSVFSDCHVYLVDMRSGAVLWSFGNFISERRALYPYNWAQIWGTISDPIRTKM